MHKFVKNLLFWIGALTIVFFFCRNKPFYITILWILAWGLVDGIANLLLSFIYRKKTGNKSQSKPDPRFDTPRKALVLFFNYRVSNLLFILNPFLMLQSFLQIAGIIWVRIFGQPIPKAEQYKQKMNYILPVAGEWCVFNGGITKETSHSWGVPSQRFAYDLVKYGQNGRSFDGDGRRLEDYFCFDARILTPAAGLVVKARDGIRDAPHVGTFWIDSLMRSLVGNSVLIKHADGEYCLLAHLKCGSVQVKTGQTVNQGQEIGRCGNSGNSTEPHLHFQFQSGESFYFSSGLPIKFTGFSLKNGEQKNFIEQDYISKNTFVSVSE